MPTRFAGQPLKRLEDPRLLRGQAAFLDDLRLPGALHVAFARSIHPHARFRVEAAAASGLSGVVGVFTAADFQQGRGFREIPAIIAHPSLGACGQPPLAVGKVRYVGEPIAAVVATSRYVAEDGAAALAIEYEPYDPVPDAQAAVAAGAALLHDQVPGNVAADFTLRAGVADEGFRTAV